jgi:hypothetical protein
LLLLTGCGTYVPGLEEPLQSAADGQQLVQAIVNNVDCEIRDAVGEVLREDKEQFRSGFRRSRRTAWLDNWGVQSTLTLELNERGEANPSFAWSPLSPASAVFGLAGGVSVSTEATRTNSVVSYYSVAQIVRDFHCGSSGRSNGPFLLQSDLKLKEWLLDVVMLQGTGVAQIPPAKEAIQHTLAFELVTSGSLTPSWILRRVSVNTGGAFLGARRGRKHVLVVTLGPLDPSLLAPAIASAAPRGRQARAAADLHLASQIGVAVSSALRNYP